MYFKANGILYESFQSIGDKYKSEEGTDSDRKRKRESKLLSWKNYKEIKKKKRWIQTDNDLKKWI